MKNNKKRAISGKKMLVTILAVVVLGTYLFSGCDADEPRREKPKSEKPTITLQEPTKATVSQDGAFEGMYKPTDDGAMFDKYEGALVLEGYHGKTTVGGTYVLPRIDETITGGYGEYANSKIDKIAATVLKTVDGSKGYAVESEDAVYFNQNGMMMLVDRNNGSPMIHSVFELYTCQTIQPEDYNYLVYLEAGSAEAAMQAILETVESEYIEWAMSDEQLTAEGMALTLEAVKQGYVGRWYPMLDAEGNVVRYDCFSYEHDFRDSYYYSHMAKISYGRDEISYLNLDMPGAISIKDKMLNAVQAFDQQKEGPIMRYTSGNWIAGRYMVFSLEIYDDYASEQAYYFLNLLTGEEESYEQMYANMGMDKQILSEQIRTLADADYQEYYAMKSGKPFNWEHNEELYARTLAEANADDVMVIPGWEGLLVCYKAYLEEGCEPVIRKLEIKDLRWSYAKDDLNIMTEAAMAMYPGMAELFEESYATETEIGYFNYGLWQHGDTIIIGMGWYDSQMNWKGYDVVCFNSVSQDVMQFSDVLASAGITASAFEAQLQNYLQSQPAFNN